MLYVAVGTLWVVSIICIIFLTTYVYRLTKRQLSEGNHSYFWTVSRVIIVLFLGLSAFYFGVASRIESLPKLAAYRLLIRDTPVWSPEAWVALSLAFGVSGILFALTDTLKNDFEIHKGLNLRLRRFEVPQLSMKIPYALTVADPQPMAERPVALRYSSQSEQFWALANVLVGLFTGCFLFVGLQTVSQLNFVQALGIDGDFGQQIAFSERVRPTATPTSEVVASGIDNSPVESIVQEDSSQITSGPASSNQESVSLAVTEDAAAIEANQGAQVEPAASDNVGAVGNDSPESISPPTSPSPSAQTSDAEAGGTQEQAEPTETENGSASDPTLVVIQEPYGVNARSGPGIDFNVVTILSNGTRHPLTGRSGDGQWFNIQLPDASSGWVASWVVEITP